MSPEFIILTVNAVFLDVIFFETNWLAFSIGTLLVMETPLFAWFARKHNLTFDDWDDP